MTQIRQCRKSRLPASSQEHNMEHEKSIVDHATHTRQYTLTLKCMLRGSKEFAVVRENTSWSEFQILSSAALVITARLRMQHIPSCTYCAVASHHRAQCSSSLKHMRNNLIAHFLVAGSILLPAHVEKLEFFNCTHHLAQQIRDANDPNTSKP